MNNKILNNITRTIKIGSFPFFISLLGSVIAAVGNTLLGLTIASMISEITNQAIANSFNIDEMINIFITLVKTIPIYTVGMMLNLTGGLNAAKNYRHTIISKSLNHHEEYIKGGHTANIMSVFTNDTFTIEDFFYQNLNYGIVHPLVQGSIGIVLLFSKSYVLALVAITIGIISLIVTLRYSKKVQEADQEARLKHDISTKSLSEIIANNDMIRMLNVNKKVNDTYHKQNLDYGDKMVEVESLKQKMNFLVTSFSYLSRTLIIGIGIYLFAQGSFDFGSIFILIPLQELVSKMFASFASTYNNLVEVSNASERVFEILDTPSEDLRENCDDFVYEESNPLIEFKDINFSYTDDTTLFNNFNLDFKPGSTTALVGESGSGKSTLFQLLLGFYEVNDGTLSIGDKNVYNYNLNSLRKQMVYIEQSAPLFSKSIKENIALGSQRDINDVSMDEIIEASKKASIHDFIMSLPEGYDTLIQEGSGQISGGQRQRIAIARAFMSPAPIVIMDEPTSALDNESEKHIQDSLELFKGSKTVLIAAHRLSTIKDSDNIVVLKKGVIQESGTHEELLKHKGYYHKLCETQLN